MKINDDTSSYFSSRSITKVLVSLFLLITSVSVLAGTVFPWDIPLSKLSQNLTGSTTTAIALIGLFVAGGALVFGGDLASFAKKVTWMILALSLMLSGPAFLNVVTDGKALPAAAALI
jgi:type IV secretory pathway VirB2 component (pilin)